MEKKKLKTGRIDSSDPLLESDFRLLKSYLEKEIEKSGSRILKMQLIYFLVQYNNLLRYSDASKIKVEDLLDEYGKVGSVLNCRDQKTKKMNVIMLSDKMVKMVKEYIKENNLSDSDYLFYVKDRTKRVSTKFFNRWLRYYKKKLGFVGNISTHSLRKGGARYLLDTIGMPLSDIMQRLNHSNTKTTLIYLKKNAEEIEKKYLQFFI